MKVWILLVFMMNGDGSSGGPVLIDNIASYFDCQKLSETLKKNSYVYQLQCIEVSKVKIN